MSSSLQEEEEVEVECRICHTKSTKGLVQPCRCKGSLAHVHVVCLEKWLRVSSNSSCELCLYTFQVVRARKYSLLQSVRVWVLKDRARIARGSLFILLLIVNPAVACWLWALWVSEIPRVFFDKGEKENSGDILVDGEEEQKISVTKWIVCFTLLTILIVVSVFILYVNVYKNILRRFFRAWRRVRNKTTVRFVLGSENAQENGEENKENGRSDSAVVKENTNSKDNECLQEIKVSSSKE